MCAMSFMDILLKVASFEGAGNIIMICCQISSAVGNALCIPFRKPA